MIAGRYALEREIGRGASGVVWLARDTLLNRAVALKRIGWADGHGTDGADGAVRAEREARLAASLNHQHVVAIYDTVVDSDSDVRWLVMEYVDGVDLADLVRTRGRLTPEEASPLLAQAADALHAAHSAGIVHRDVKPSNILVDRDGRVKLTDFGIARLGDDASLTRTGMVTGSPAYLAPEVASGGRGDAKADVWSLGATGFHVLAGRPPYDVGDNILGALYRIVHEEPPRLDDAGPMAGFLDRAMAKDPTRRWSMAQVRDDLREVGGAAPRASRPVAPAPVVGSAEPSPRDSRTDVLPTTAPPAAGPPAVAAPEPDPESAPAGGRRLRAGWLLGVVAVLLVLVLGGYLAFRPGSGDGGGPDATGSSTPSKPNASATPTKQGIESFIRTYVATVTEDTDKAWAMLTPKFQRASGGIEKYREFWKSATNGQVGQISADPKSLRVSYHVHFDNFDHNGSTPTVLDLKFVDGKYLIDEEHSKGFVPAD